MAEGGLVQRYLEQLRQETARVALGLLVIVLFVLHAAEYVRIDIIKQLDLIAYDARLRLTQPGGRDDRIVIVDIDERSIAAEGRFPWNRKKMAQLVELLFARYHAALVAFDIFFTEADESSGLGLLEGLASNELRDDAAYRQRLGELRGGLEYDAQFAKSLAKRPVVLAYYFNLKQADGAALAPTGMLPDPVFANGYFKGRNIAFLRATGYAGNLEQLQRNAAAGGFAITVPDADGVVRRVPMLMEYDGAYYGALSLEVARLLSPGAELEPRFEKAAFARRGYSGFETLRLGQRQIPIDRNVQVLVPYRGRQGSFPYISATDVLQGKADPTLLSSKIVLVGTSAPGLLDLRATPMQETYPGVEVHANLIAGMLDNNLKAAPEYALGAEVLLLVLFGLALALLAPALNPVGQALLTGGLLLAHVALNLYFWMALNLVFPVASGILMLLVMFLLNMSWGYFSETRGRQQLAGLFGQYVPPELVTEMAKSPERYSLAPENRELTVLFSDVRGFTSIAEGLTPADLSELMNRLLTPMTEIIHRHRGTIDKYMGDAIMAFWGAPLHDLDHARHALQAALEMQRQVRTLNTTFRERGWPEIHIGIGINTGAMNVGNMGSQFRMAYTVMGDAVNLASRLEGLTKVYGTGIIVGEQTAAALPEFAFRELDRVTVKGKDKSVAILEPLGLEMDLDHALRDELKLYRQALKYYRSRDWDRAELQFLNLAKTGKAPELYRMYAERVAHFRKAPPGSDWDGVFRHQLK